jgi:hypothetical protein
VSTQLSRLLALILAACFYAAPRHAHAGAEVRLDREFLSGLVEKLPSVPFQKAGQYHGSARAFRLVAIDPQGRRLIVACEVKGEFRPPIAGAIRRAVTPPGPKIKPTATPTPAPSPPPPSGEDGWKAFAFDVRASVKAEPGLEGVPRFSVDVEQVKRRELEGVAGLLALMLGRQFDEIVTQVASGKVSSLNEKLNARLRDKVAKYKEYGVLREIGYAPEQVVLIFDVTRYKSEGVAGYVFAAAAAGTVPLYRWTRPRLGGHYYATDPGPPRGHPYYVYESVACHVFDKAQPGTVPLQRWQGPREWLFVTAANGPELLTLTRAGYRPEAVACHVYPVSTPGTVPLYRFVDPRTGFHFFTTHPHAEFAK